MLGQSAAQFYVWFSELRYNTKGAVSKRDVLYNVVIGAVGHPANARARAHTHTHTHIELRSRPAYIQLIK